MKHFRTIFYLDRKRFLSPVLLIIAGAVAVGMALFTLGERPSCNESIKNAEHVRALNHINLERAQTTKSYQDYSLYGIISCFLPSPVIMMFKSSGPTMMPRGVVDSLERIDILYTAKGDLAVASPLNYSFHAASIFLILCAAGVLFLGVDLLQKRGLHRYLSSVTRFKPALLWGHLVGARLLILNIYLLYIWGLFFGVLYICGFNFPAQDLPELAGLLLTAWIVLLVFFIAGVVIGSIKNKLVVIIISITVYFVLVFLIPIIFGAVPQAFPPPVASNFKAKFDKVRTIEDFEADVKQKHGRLFEDFDLKDASKLVEYYWSRIYPRVEAVDTELREQIQTKKDLYRLLCLAIPTTFYQLTCNEVGSNGHNAHDSFFGYLLELKKSFLRFWIDRVYYHDPKVVISFIKDDEHIFQSRSSLPKGWGYGLLINFTYCLLLLIGSYLRFKRIIAPPPKKERDYSKIVMELRRGEPCKLWLYEDDLKAQIFNTFSGRIWSTGLGGKISLSGRPLEESNGIDFIYVPGPESFPSFLKVRHLLHFLARTLDIGQTYVKRLEKDMLGEKLLNKYMFSLTVRERAGLIAKIYAWGESGFFIFDDFLREIPFNDHLAVSLEVSRRFANKKGAVILDVTTIMKCAAVPVKSGGYQLEYKDGVYSMTRLKKPPPEETDETTS